MSRIRETLAWVKHQYADEFEELYTIAVDVYHGKRGGFIKKYADAWMHADMGNKYLMKPVWEALIRRHNLEEDPKGTGASTSRANP